jgi:hypothetical protein
MRLSSHSAIEDGIRRSVQSRTNICRARILPCTIDLRISRESSVLGWVTEASEAVWIRIISQTRE